MNISIKLVYQYMAIFFNFPPTSNHLHPLQVENCDSNSRLVVDEDDNGKFRLERVKVIPYPFSKHETLAQRWFTIEKCTLLFHLNRCINTFQCLHVQLMNILVYL